MERCSFSIAPYLIYIKPITSSPLNTSPFPSIRLKVNVTQWTSKVQTDTQQMFRRLANFVRLGYVTIRGVVVSHNLRDLEN